MLDQWQGKMVTTTNRTFHFLLVLTHFLEFWMFFKGHGALVFSHCYKYSQGWNDVFFFSPQDTAGNKDKLSCAFLRSDLSFLPITYLTKIKVVLTSSSQKTSWLPLMLDMQSIRMDFWKYWSLSVMCMSVHFFLSN